MANGVNSARKTYRLNLQETHILQFALGALHFMFVRNFPNNIQRKGFTDAEVLNLSQKIAYEGE